MLLAAIASSLLLSVTMQISTDLMTAPLFWVVPLAVYLLTFVVAFSTGRKPARHLLALLTTIGIVQYLTPILQFTLGVTVLGEHMPPERWIGFGLVWIALAVFTADAVHSSRRRQLALTVDASTV